MSERSGDKAVMSDDMALLRFCLKALYGHEFDELADTLAARFGSVSGIFGASYEELSTVPEVTPRVASFFSSVMPINRQALLRAAIKFPLGSERALTEFFCLYFLGLPIGTDVCACLNKGGEVIAVHVLGEEGRVREIARIVCEDDAAAFVLARRVANLTQKNPVPTTKRRKFVRRVALLAGTFDTEFTDYLEIDGGVFFSMRAMLDGKTPVRHLEKADEAPYIDAPDILNKLDAKFGLDSGDRKDI